jgi:hypothetical protein
LKKVCAFTLIFKGGDPELVRQSQAKRFADVTLVDKVIEIDGITRTGKLNKTNF